MRARRAASPAISFRPAERPAQGLGVAVLRRRPARVPLVVRGLTQKLDRAGLIEQRRWALPSELARLAVAAAVRSGTPTGEKA